jgi:Rne/Rng family ribonuclease
MAKEICISSTPHETRLAILEDDQLAEIYYERENEYTLAGSVYKGRVTRVLPGMQSAFVDIGLERDAFLYVTDFLEMEDPEDTDEVERAASQGDTVRVVTQQSGQQGGQQPAQPAQQQPQSRGGRPDRDGQRGRRGEPRPAATQTDAPLQFETLPSVNLNPELESGSAPASDATAGQEETDEQGARRWRGRRRRRGGRGRDESAAPSTAGGEEGNEELAESHEMATEEADDQMEFEAAGPAQAHLQSQRQESQRQAPAAGPSGGGAKPFMLPGESLSKYGIEIQKPAPSRLIVSELPPDTSDPWPDRTVAKPSTLIEDEIVWDGKGLLPGESLARHAATQPRAQAAPPTAPAHVEEPVLVGEFDSYEVTEHDANAEGLTVPDDEEFQEEEMLEEEIVEHQESSEEHFAEHLHTHDAEAQEEEIHEGSASHNVDPLPPSGFRFADLFGGKKKEPEAAPAQAPKPEQKSVPKVTAYAHGGGMVEEEVIEDEEYEFTPLKAHHGDEHDLEELEEETLQQQIRSGALGEMLHEAHQESKFGSRVLIESDDDESDESSDAIAPSGGRQAGSGRERSGDRGGDRNRGRRGRTGSSGGSSSSGGGDNRRGPGGHSRRSMQTSDLPIISDLLKPGQEILVQIAKEPIAKKGARITSHIALPGRFLVFMPTVSHVGVSRKIASDEERHRLKRILVSEKGEASGGFIVRTAAEGATEEELRADLRFLINLWNDIKQRADTSKPPALIYHDLNLIERILRDQVSDNFSHIWVDSEADYERIVRFLNRFSPELVRRVKLYTKEVPLFEHFGIQDEISKALRSKVWLKSGGSIVINQTEALVAIDINTGKYVGKTARLEDTIVKTNLDSIPEIVRQIRLRDLGGIIIIDFIDMDERKNRTRVMAALEEALKQDRAPTKVLQFNDFGLVAITRKRVKQSLERTLSVPCPVCQATGMVKSAATVANEIYIEVRKMRKHFDGTEVMVRVNPETAKALKSNNAKWLNELEELSGKNVLVKSDATLHPEQFDIQG